MTVDEAFEDPRELISSAHSRLREAIDFKNDFFGDPDVYRLDILKDEPTGEIHVKIRAAKVLPKRFETMVRQVCADLRDALDHAVYASALCVTGLHDVPHTAFPFGQTRADVEARLKSGALRGNPASLRPFLLSLDVNEAGNPVLYSLNKIRNPNTHQFIVPVAEEVGALSTRIQIKNPRGDFGPGPGVWDPLKKEMTVFVYRPYMLNQNAEINVPPPVMATMLRFDKVAQVKGKEVTSALKDMIAETTRIVQEIEAETRRLTQDGAPSASPPSP